MIRTAPLLGLVGSLLMACGQAPGDLPLESLRASESSAGIPGTGTAGPAPEPLVAIADPGTWFDLDPRAKVDGGAFRIRLRGASPGRAGAGVLLQHRGGAFELVFFVRPLAMDFATAFRVGIQDLATLNEFKVASYAHFGTGGGEGATQGAVSCELRFPGNRASSQGSSGPAFRFGAWHQVTLRYSAQRESQPATLRIEVQDALRPRVLTYAAMDLTAGLAPCSYLVGLLPNGSTVGSLDSVVEAEIELRSVRGDMHPIAADGDQVPLGLRETVRRERNLPGNAAAIQDPFVLAAWAEDRASKEWTAAREAFQRATAILASAGVRPQELQARHLFALERYGNAGDRQEAALDATWEGLNQWRSGFANRTRSSQLERLMAPCSRSERNAVDLAAGYLFVAERLEANDVELRRCRLTAFSKCPSAALAWSLLGRAQTEDQDGDESRRALEPVRQWVAGQPGRLELRVAFTCHQSPADAISELEAAVGLGWCGNGLIARFEPEDEQQRRRKNQLVQICRQRAQEIHDRAVERAACLGVGLELR